MSSSRVLKGIGVSPGLREGTAYVVSTEVPEVVDRVIAPESVEEEVERLRETVADARTHLEELRDRTRDRAGPEEAKIFDAQILMLEDRDFLGEVEGLIRGHNLSAESAFEFKMLELRDLWAHSSSATLRQRVADLSGVQIRVLRRLLGDMVMPAEPERGSSPIIVFTTELTPGLTVQFERDHVAGFVSEQGTRTAHAAILARSLGIPCVMGLVGGLEEITDGTRVAIDGTHGMVIIDPTDEELDELRDREQRRLALEHELEAAVGQPAVTVDGTPITLRANIDLLEDVDMAAEHGAVGVGLLRTELLILGRTKLPAEDEQVRFFQRVGVRFPDAPIIVRTYDLGGDKFPAPFKVAPENNPFLGWRAIRVCLDHPELFSGQVRAALRARAHADVQLMLPMVTQVEEVDRTRELVQQCAADLKREGIEAADDIPVGAMIETPAAAMIVDLLASRCDFLSVGSNDLTQYALAVDRGNAQLANRFTPFHPAVVRLLRTIVEQANRAGQAPTVCGEMASEPVAAYMLIGLGYRVLSVSPARLPLVRWIVRQLDVPSAQSAMESLSMAQTAKEITKGLQERIADHIDLKLLELGRLPVNEGEATFKV